MITGLLESIDGRLAALEWGVCPFGDCLPLLDCRGKSRIPQSAQSVILILLPYYAGEHPARNVARYAVARDYHEVAGELLRRLCEQLAARFPKERHVPFVDRSPIREVRAAALAGLGLLGRHGQLVSRRFGSHVFIGEIVTTLKLAPTGGRIEPCGGCGACIQACPTGALRPEGGLDRERCRSHITQKKGELTSWEREQIAAGGLAWGCDLCTDACPLNTKTLSPVREFWEDPAPTLDEARMEALMQTRAYGYRGEKTLRRNLEIMMK